MNSLCTLLNKISKSTIIAQQLDDIGNLIAIVIRDDLGRDSKSLITNWSENNGEYLDFSFALRPDWLVGTPDDKQVTMRISIDTSDQSWYAYLVMDCEDGECESYGEKEFTRAELEEYSMPVKSMLEVIHGQYINKLREDANQKDKDLKVAEKVAKRIKTHLDAINKICKENNIQIYTDGALDSCHSHFLVPDSIEPVEEVRDDEIPLDQFPSFDFDGKWFDSSYEAFVRK